MSFPTNECSGYSSTSSEGSLPGCAAVVHTAAPLLRLTRRMLLQVRLWQEGRERLLREYDLVLKQRAQTLTETRGLPRKPPALTC